MRTPLWKAPFLSFYSKAFYGEVAATWRARAFLYLFLLLAVCWSPALFRLGGVVGALRGPKAEELLDRVPEIRIRSGVVEADCDAPCLIEGEHGETVAIIDTTGQVDSLSGTPARILLTRDSVMVRKGEREIRTYDLSQIQNVTLDRPTLSRWMRLAATLIRIVVPPVVLILSYAWRVAQVLLLVLLGLIVSSLLGVRAPFPALAAMACLALTPMMVLKSILGVFGASLPLGLLLSPIITIAFLLWGMSSLEKPGPE